MQTPYKAPSNYLPIDKELFIASFPHDCSVKAIIHSATYFSIPPPPTSSVIFRVPDQRRCLLSLSLVFYPGAKINIYDASINIKFGQNSLAKPSILGYQFLSLEQDTSFLETFHQHLSTVPSLLNGAWYTSGYHDLFNTRGKSEAPSNPAWGTLASNDLSSLTLTSEGALGTPPGVPSVLPVCILFDFEDPPCPSGLMASVTVSARLEEQGSRLRSLLYRLKRHKVTFPSVAICKGPKLPVKEGDKGIARRSWNSSRNSQLKSSQMHSARAPAVADVGASGASAEATAVNINASRNAIPSQKGKARIRPTIPVPLPPPSSNMQVLAMPSFSPSVLELQSLPVASRPAPVPVPTITLTDYSVKIVNKGKARQIDFAQVVTKDELRDLVATLDFRPKDPVSLSATELRAQNMLFAAQSLVIRFLMEEPGYEQPDLYDHGEGVLIRAMQDKIDTAILMELGTTWSAIQMTINNIFSKARALKEVDRQMQELDEPVVEKREIQVSPDSTRDGTPKIDDSPIDPMLVVRPPPVSLLKRKGQLIRTAAAKQRVRWAIDGEVSEEKGEGGSSGFYI